MSVNGVSPISQRLAYLAGSSVSGKPAIFQIQDGATQILSYRELYISALDLGDDLERQLDCAHRGTGPVVVRLEYGRWIDFGLLILALESLDMHPLLVAPGWTSESVELVTHACKGSPHIDLRGSSIRIVQGSAMEMRNHPDTRSLFCSVLTSGSTGVPNIIGLESPHEFVRQTSTLSTDQVATIGHALPLGSVASIQLFLSSLWMHKRRTVGVVDITSSDDIGDAINSVGLDSLALLPHQAPQVADSLSRVSAAEELKVITFTGARLSNRYTAMIKDVAPRAAIVNNFSATEVSPAALVCHDEQLPDDLVYRGKPSEDTRVRILGPAGRDVSVGMWGELALAYADSDALSFRRTGDEARVAESGVVEIRGRAGRSTLVNGVPLSLSHIEVVAGEATGRDAVAVRRSIKEDEVLSVVLAGEESERVRRKVINELRSALPPGVPLEIQFIDEIPRSPHDKVELWKLCDLLDEERLGTSSDRLTLKGLIGIVAEVTKRETQTISPYEPFRSMGVDSLASLEISFALFEVGVEVAPHEVAQASCADDLFDKIESSLLGSMSRSGPRDDPKD